MAAWALGLLLLLPDLQGDLQAALDQSRVARDGLGLLAGRAGEAPALAVGADELRAPASNQKLLTAAAALTMLGRDFRFQTRIAVGPDGELVVIGDGDPNLSGRFFDGDPTKVLRLMAHDVAQKGVRTVKELVLDASRFDTEYRHPDWPADQLDRWYCAPVAALVYNDSCWDVLVAPTRPGAAARVEVQPSLLHPEILNRCETVADRGRHVVHLARADGYAFEVRGAVAASSDGVPGNITVDDPVRFFGEAFLGALAAEGVTVTGGLRVGRVEGARDLAVYRSGLDRTLRVMLKDSQNLYAECLFKRAGEGSFASGRDAVLGTLRRLGLPTEGLDIRDGSGLSHGNRVTARALYGVLQAFRDEPLLVEALAEGGEGTLRRRYRDLGPRLRAKTGTIKGVTALSGYVTGRDGGRYVFVILANGRAVARARRLQDLVVLALAREP